MDTNLIYGDNLDILRRYISVEYASSGSRRTEA